MSAKIFIVKKSATKNKKKSKPSPPRAARLRDEHGTQALSLTVGQIDAVRAMLTSSMRARNGKWMSNVDHADVIRDICDAAKKYVRKTTASDWRSVAIDALLETNPESDHRAIDIIKAESVPRAPRGWRMIAIDALLMEDDEQALAIIKSESPIMKRRSRASRTSTSGAGQ